jgi:2-keto-3-deoxy-L-rhamnonate aldolase RhmA
MERVAKACGAQGKGWGSVPAGAAYADRCAEMGCRMLTFGSDVLAMRLGVQALKTMYASQFKTE